MTVNVEKLISSDLAKLPYEDLIKVQEAVAGLIQQQRHAAKQDLLKEIQEKASALGRSFDDLLPEKGKGKEKAKSNPPGPAKYKNPNDPSKTWSGRGRKPKWLEEWLAGGGNLDGLKV